MKCPSLDRLLDTPSDFDEHTEVCRDCRALVVAAADVRRAYEPPGKLDREWAEMAAAVIEVEMRREASRTALGAWITFALALATLLPPAYAGFAAGMSGDSEAGLVVPLGIAVALAIVAALVEPRFARG